MDSMSEAQGVDLLFRKLGHNISEIRTRALDSILSKLDHGLIHDADLVQERQLMVRLLEWFNFQPSPNQDKVLQLLARLSKHASACDLLVSIGAVTFLTRLRTDLDSSLRPQIDTVIDRMLHITDRDLLRAQSASRRCVYGKANNQSEPLEMQAPESDKFKYGYFTQPSDSMDESTSSATPPAPKSAEKHVDIQPTCNADCLRFAGFPWHSLTGTDRHVLASTGTSLCSPSAHLVRNACAFLLDVIFRDFPHEIFLQRPTIIQTLLTLVSSRPGGQLMTSALDCLQSLAEGILSRLHYFQDPCLYCPRQGLPFHSENRPSTQISSVGSFSPSDVASREGADGAIRFERSGGDGRDDRSSSSSSAMSSTRSTPIARNQPAAHATTFHDGFGSLTWNSSDIDDETESNVPILQRSQMIAPQFCLASLIAALPSIRTESTRLALSLLQTCVPLVGLLIRTIRVDKLWIEKSVLAQNLQAQVRQLLEIAGDALSYHYHMDPSVSTSASTGHNQNGWTNKQWSSKELQLHRLVFQTLAVILMKLVRGILPIDQASVEVKSSLGAALYVIACDEALRLSCPEECDAALSYLEACNPDRHEVAFRARKVANSFAHLHMFLRDYRHPEHVPVTIELMELAESSLDGLPYRTHGQLIKTAVRAISQVYLRQASATEDANQLLTTSKRVLLHLMAHPLVRVRRITYEESLRIARSGINVSTAAENPDNAPSHACRYQFVNRSELYHRAVPTRPNRFLLDSDILYEICCHGLGDSSRLVSHPAQELITLLLEGRLLVAESVWKDFCVAVKPALPVLQAYTGDTELLRSAINVYISPKEHSFDGSDTESIRACLRALMLKHRASRSSAANRLHQMISTDDILSRISGLTDLLIVDTPLSLVSKDETDCFRIRRSVFQEEAVVRMLSVFRSTTTENSVRMGALRQLATMLDDPGLHSAFLANNGMGSVADKLKELVAEDVTVLTDDAKISVGACVSITKLMLRRDSVTRGRLSRDRDLLLTLLRAASLCRLSIAALADVAVVIALVAFHDVMRERERLASENVSTAAETTELSLPAAIVTRYQMPFLCPSHHTVSVHRQLVYPPSPSCDPLTEGPPADTLRLAWNMSLFDSDVEALLGERITKDAGHTEESSDEIIDLRLNEANRMSLLLSHPVTSSAALISNTSSARTHAEATHAFSLFRILLLNPQMNLPSVQALLLGTGDNWKDAFAKFLQVLPTCYEDELLLSNLTSLLDKTLSVIETQTVDDFDDVSLSVVTWLLDTCLLTSTCKNQKLLENIGSPFLKVLESSEPQPEPATASVVADARMSSVSVRRQLCKAILSMLSRLSRLILRAPGVKKESIVRFHRELRTVLLVRLRLADAPQFYDLPSMEVTLECLVHISANMVAASNRNASLDPTDRVLLQQLLGTLLEIVSAFHVGSGASTLSYMGKGVSRCATQCILHFIQEMAFYRISDWVSLLEYVVPTPSVDRQLAADSLGLEWLISLWSARDPRTRFAGLAIASAASQSKKGCVALSNAFQRYPGGLWHTVMCVFLDHSECSFVREQACYLLCNMISHPFDDVASDVTPEQSWQGPVVQDETTGTTVTGLPALSALIRHAHVADHIMLLLSHYHADYTVRSPATLTDAIHVDPTVSKTSLASMAGSDSDVSDRSSMTPLTQPSVSNPFPSFSSANKDTFVSSAASVQSGADNGGRRGTAVTSLPDEWRALTSPSLVAAVCDLLCCLVSKIPHETVKTFLQKNTLFYLNSLLEIDRIERIFAKLTVTSEDDCAEGCDAAKQKRRSMHARSLLKQLECTAKLLTACAVVERGAATTLISAGETFVKNAVAVLALEEIDETWSGALNGASHAALDLVCALVHQHLKNPLSTAVIRQWTVLYGGISRILKNDSHDLVVPALKTLALLFKSESVARDASNSSVSLTWVIEKSKGSTCDAQDLCLTLIGIFESTIAKPSAGIPGDDNDRLTSCGQALQNLLACSNAAKEAAMEGGFLERCLEEIKRLHLTMSLRFTTSISSKGATVLPNDPKSQFELSDCESFVQPVLLIVSSLTNLLHDIPDNKKHAASVGLGQVLGHLWSWTPVFNNLSVPLLRLIATYTANCEQASASLAVNHTSGQPSIAASLVRACREVHGSVLSRSKTSAPLLHLTFNVLVNCSAAHECRALIWKANILELFASAADRGQHPKRSKQQWSLLEHWLRLLLALSFHTDGQLNILKIRDIFDILVELHASNSHSKLVMLLIRSLCFHAPSKHRISSNKPIVRLLMSSLDMQDEAVNLTASSALWSLLYNNQKAKVHLKGAGLTKSVQNAIARLTLAENADDRRSDFKTFLTNVLEILRN